jgi:DNA-binding transcriptional LysR family regulator
VHTGGPVTLAEHAQSRWIAGCERCRRSLVRQCASAGFAPSIAFTTDDYVAAQALVAAGLGVTTLPALALRAHHHPGVLVTRLAGAARRVWAATYGEPPDLPATARLIDDLRAAAEYDVVR